MSKQSNNSLAKVAAACAATCFLAAIMVFLVWQGKMNAATDTPPSPTSEATESVSNGDGEDITSENNLFPEVDWEYWQSVNPDIIGWITIPGSNINSPIVKAASEDLDYYLSHDVYKKWNPYGAIYLDSDCASDIFSNPNAVIYGHHMSDGTMFAEVANYTDYSWAQEHQEILIQTPDKQEVLALTFSNTINANTEGVITEFPDEETYEAWLIASANSATTTLNATDPNKPTITLTTCSYTTYQNERTLAHFQQLQEQ